MTFSADCSEQYDQAGLFIRSDEATWIKAGVEFADGALQAGAVVTHGRSDWSSGRFWGDGAQTVTVRASRSGDAIAIRMRAGDDLLPPRARRPHGSGGRAVRGPVPVRPVQIGFHGSLPPVGDHRAGRAVRRGVADAAGVESRTYQIETRSSGGSHRASLGTHAERLVPRVHVADHAVDAELLGRVGVRVDLGDEGLVAAQRLLRHAVGEEVALDRREAVEDGGVVEAAAAARSRTP